MEDTIKVLKNKNVELGGKRFSLLEVFEKISPLMHELNVYNSYPYLINAIYGKGYDADEDDDFNFRKCLGVFKLLGLYEDYSEESIFKGEEVQDWFYRITKKGSELFIKLNV